MTTPPTSTETAILAGGCFWCLEAAYERVRGVTAVKSGYAGGKREHPTYDQVCSGATGHAEVVQVTYDPTQVTYKNLLEIFFTIHDPTQLNRQGPDVGTQYRSAIFPVDDTQAAIAREVIGNLVLEQVFDLPVVTTVEEGHKFWPAESTHDRYYKRHPFQPYCLAVISPKLAKLRAKHASLVVSS